MDSLRSPLRLTIIGSDAKEYPFLVKLGEDLRQDQRIEQMFGLMNNIFDSDSVCREKRLNIRTYQVIPLTDILGLIEWVPNTVTYKQLLIQTNPDFKNISERIIPEQRKRYLGWHPDTPKPDINYYMKSVQRNSVESTKPVYKYLVNRIPADIFRQAIRKLSIDAESFVALRTKFITSHIVTSMADWIMGIGDRHLRNSLISLTNAETVDIDFGYALGAGVQIMPIPEVVPFRLTPHIVELMQPLKEHGLIEETMIHVLRALRNNPKSLLSTVSVFITEPSLEWMEFTSSGNKYNWCPEKKLEHVKRKLEGANPVDIMVEELTDRIWSPDWLSARDAYIECVKGIKKDNIRARLTGNLSVEDQVQCLLDHATDPNILCRLYEGFESWI